MDIRIVVFPDGKPKLDPNPDLSWKIFVDFQTW